ncbi:diacylglycerol kinase [Candidatus Kuenenbacteria bacterium CG_4_9_14_3_um_filter_39_14]|uniref:Diacylglycerol kinase n=6 Tax=Candidatus Kueneniibacteriota TaxID=1752740 RepID=A0A2M7ILB3_9BACT|nr:diacylglycerol kinase family protein [Candidatus Kuenenbacteria bacterium]PIP28926.1 MAG: diacylglycerol kinase [Candidatus Kuenenbacteria bacterium CG23_combo_of_CG06-09_8_20_14_all_39_39]PIP75745.1 MAG: diacylglycerol kinase [Candidatus Kuenenbacteria bacterium CG22_combo_CG10-13_8_21_14_all_39_9]PIR81073.1 MAG: diacylglycerol kinase [Candidatus Kuenenbacteria bacterium CG10_big_fil_rev_8_21_14_0_10_39_14]PIW95591.1 MAG: diacylglycerol kinase [Candidatus Kuenenbacteria bacterium CG_4_8_14_
MIKLNQLIRSFSYALRGFKFVWQEQNFKIQILIALIVVILMYLYNLTRLERVALIIVISAVLILESLNTIFEHLADILKPRLHDYIMIIKDIMAAIVLMASIGAVIIGLLIFWPYFFG